MKFEHDNKPVNDGKSWQDFVADMLDFFIALWLIGWFLSWAFGPVDENGQTHLTLGLGVSTFAVAGLYYYGAKKFLGGTLIEYIFKRYFSG